MKRITTILMTTAVMIAALATTARAAEDRQGPVRIELREGGPARIVFVAEEDDAAARPPKMEKASFIGVVTAPITAELSAQLNLPPGVGLRVAQVMPDSPAAAAGIKEHDVLHKLGDQLLVNSDQLRTLVRTHHKGDELALTVITAGKSNQVKVTVDEREMPVAEAGGPMIRFGPEGNADMLRRLWQHGGPGGPGNRLWIQKGDGNPGDAQATTTAMYRDDEHKLTLKSENGKKHLKVEDKDGKVIFDGPVNTDEERKAVPEAVRPKLDKLDASTRVHVGGGDQFLFQGGDAANVEEMRNRILQELDELIKGEGGPGQPGAQIDIDKLRERIRQQMDKALQGHQGAVQRQEIHIGPNSVQTSATASYSDGEHTLTVKSTNGDKHLVAKDKDGKVLFDGPINTDAEKAKVPEDIRKKLDRLEASAKIHIQINPAPGQPAPGQPAPPKAPEPPRPQAF